VAARRQSTKNVGGGGVPIRQSRRRDQFGGGATGLGLYFKGNISQ